MFPEMMEFKTAEERLSAVLHHRVSWWQGMRDKQAASWRRARRSLRDLPELTRRGLIIYWQTCSFPGSPEYLLSMIHDAKKGVSFWHTLADRRRMQLIGAGKLEAPWKRRAQAPMMERCEPRRAA